MRYISVRTYTMITFMYVQNIFMSINSFIFALKLELFLVCDILFKANILHFCTKNDNIRAGPAILEIEIAKRHGSYK